MWDDGISGAVLDYNIAANTTFSHLEGEGNSTFIGANGVAGLNFGSWRFRADWQSSYQKS